MTEFVTVDVDAANINEILQQSTQKHVLLYFWSANNPSCNTMEPLLVKLLSGVGDRMVLAKVDMATQAMIAQQLGVQSEPALKVVYQGQLAGELNGEQSEENLRNFLESYVGDIVLEEEGADPFMMNVERARKMGAYDEAITALESAIQEHPEKLEYQAAYADLLMDQGRYDDADAVIDNINDEAVSKPKKARLFFIKETTDSEPLDILRQQVESNSGGSEPRYLLGMHLLLKGQLEAGLQLLLSIMMNDRGFKEDAARKALLMAFDFIETGDPLVMTYRRKMFACLH